MGVIYKKLKSIGGVCRIDGVSSVRTDSILGHMVNLHVAKLDPSDAINPYNPKKEIKPHQLPVHSASLHHLQPGAIWTEGRKTSSPPDIVSSDGRLKSVTVDTSLYKGVSLSDDFKALIPNYEYKFGKKNLTSLSDMKFIKVPILNDPKNKYLLVPCVELIRFYIGVSSRFMSSALEGSFDNYFDSKESKVSNGEVTLKLKKRIRRSESIVLARYVADRHAASAFRAPFKWLQKQHQANFKNNANNPLNIYGFFPFSDLTTLKVSGFSNVFVPNGDDEHSKDRCIIAFKINSCSFPKSFSKIHYDFEDGAYSPNYTDDNSGEPPEPGFFHPEDKKDEEDKEIDNDPADKRLRRLGITTSANPFPGFRDISYEIHVKPGEDRLFGRPVSSYPEKDVLTDADGNYSDDSKGQRGTDHYIKTPSHNSRDLSLFVDMINAFRSRHNENFSVITLGINSDIIDSDERISQFPRMKGRFQWHIIKGSGDYRQFICAEFKHKSSGNKFYLLELELDPDRKNESHGTALIFTHNFDSISEETFNDYLKLSVYGRRRWAIPEPELDWGSSDLKKYADEADAFFNGLNIHAFRIPHSHAKKKEESSDIRIDPQDWCSSLVKSLIDKDLTINDMFDLSD